MNENGRAQPANWRWTSVGKLGDVSGGITKNSSKANLSIKRPYLRVANVYANELRLDDIAEIGVTQAESVRALLVKGDLLVVEGNGSVDQIGRVALWNGAISPCLHQNHLIKVRFGTSDLGPFVLYWLLSSEGREQVVRAASSTSGLHTLSLSKVANLPAPVAPLPEQHRIVEAIESYFTRLDDAVATLERVQRNLKRYRASVLKAAVEGRLVPTEAELARAEGRDYEPASVLLERILTERRSRWDEAGSRGKYEEPAVPDTTNLPDLPEGWCWASIDQLALIVRNGYSTAPNALHGVRILRISAVRPLSVDFSDVRFLPPPAQQYERDLVAEGDLLFTRYNGSPALVGVCGRVRHIDQATVHPDKLIKVRLVPLGLNWAYVELAANAGASRKHIERRTRTTAGQAGVSGSDIKQMPVPLPPMSEQQRIEEEVERVLSVATNTSTQAMASAHRCARLRQSILKWAFEGKLADQDPSDEPASVLLERIRTETAARMASATSGATQKRRGRRGTMAGTKHEK